MEPTQKLRQAIKDYKNGTNQAFDVLYQESSKYIYTCIYKVMCGNDNAQDAVNDIMQDKEKQRLLREIIQTELTEMQKLCIIAYYYNEQKQSEIAKELGIPKNTVKTNLSRAKAKIKEGVLDLEKKKGTKLYSITPFMLLLFKDEVYAAVVPQKITKNVLASVSMSASTVASEVVATAGVKSSGAATANVVSSAVKSIAGKVVLKPKNRKLKNQKQWKQNPRRRAVHEKLLKKQNMLITI